MATFRARRPRASLITRGTAAWGRVGAPPAIVASALAVAATGAGGCSADDATLAVDAAIDHPSIVLTPDANVPFEATIDAAPLETSVRVALMSDLGFGIDICVRSVGSSSVVTSPYIGPLLFEKLPSFPDAGNDAGKQKDADAAHLDGTLRDAHEDAGKAGPAESGAGDVSTTDAEGGTDAVADGTNEASDARVDATARDSMADTREDTAEGGRGGAVADGSADAELSDAGERVGGVPARQVSTYLSIQQAGTFDVAIVLGGSSSCSGAIPVQRVTLDAGKFTTLVVMGSVSSAKDGGTDAAMTSDAARVDATLTADASKDASGDATKDAASDAVLADASSSTIMWTIVALTDEPAPSSTLAKARFFNAAGGGGDAGVPGTLRVSALGQNAAVPIADRVPFDRASLPNPASPAVDSLGYWLGAPVVSTVPISLRASPTFAAVDAANDHDDAAAAPSWTFQSTSFDLVAATDHTGFFVGGGGSPLELVWCDDTTSAGASALTSCAVTTGQ